MVPAQAAPAVQFTTSEFSRTPFSIPLVLPTSVQRRTVTSWEVAVMVPPRSLPCLTGSSRFPTKTQSSTSVGVTPPAAIAPPEPRPGGETNAPARLSAKRQRRMVHPPSLTDTPPPCPPNGPNASLLSNRQSSTIAPPLHSAPPPEPPGSFTHR